MSQHGGMRTALRRMADLVRCDPAVAAARSTAADLGFVRGAGDHAAPLMAAACERFAARPCLSEPQGEGWLTITYGQLWDRVRRIAGGLRRHFDLRPGQRVILCADGTVDWIAVDLACLFVGAVSVPLPANLSDEDWSHIVSEVAPAVVAVDSEQLERARQLPLLRLGPGEGPGLAVSELESQEAAPLDSLSLPGQDAVFSVVYTSGSTGRPKGVILPETRWTTTLRGALDSRPLPQITVGYLPLSHMAGRITVYTTLIVGGHVHLVPQGAMASLFDAIRSARPTHLTLIPRVSGLVYQHFQSELARRGGPGADPKGDVALSIMAEMRSSFLGDRLCFGTTGAAPTPPEVVAFLERCFEMHVIDNYGSTEIGQVAVGGRVQPWIDYKLVDRPELGYTRADRPFPRGELAIKSPNETPGYLGNDEASAKLRDEHGFILTGDIVEERGPRTIAVIDRAGSSLRLASGEFVQVDRIENALVSGSPYIEQAFIYGNPLRSFVLAVLVPTGLAMDRASEESELYDLLRAELERVSATHPLAAHEIPRDLVVEREPFSVERGLLTETRKPRRPRLRDHYRGALEDLYRTIEDRQLGELGELHGDPAERVQAAVALTLGLGGPSAIDSSRGFVHLGGDSFSAVRLRDVIRQTCGVELPVATILDPTTTIEALGRAVAAGGEDSAWSRVHGGDTTWVRARDLRADRLIPEAVLSGAAALPGPSEPSRVLLTGANGFLGRFLVLELLRRDDRTVVAMVRGSHTEDATRRLLSAFASPALRAEAEAAMARKRLVVVAGDLHRERLGLEGEVYAELAGDLDAIIHNGALVNHALPYRDLFEPNVVGTARVAELALTTRRKRLCFVSTVGVAAGIKRRTAIEETETAETLWSRRPAAPDGPAYAFGYGTSKWAAEIILGRIAERTGLPVSIVRCSMILPHRRAPEELNRSDGFLRLLTTLLATGLAPTSFYADDHAGPRHYDGLPVDVVAAVITASLDGPPGIVHASNSAWNDGVSLDRMVEWIEGGGRALRRLPYPAWLDATTRALASLPDEQRRMTIEAILHRWREPATGRELILDTRRCQALYQGATAASGLPSLDEAYLTRILEALGILDIAEPPPTR